MIGAVRQCLLAGMLLAALPFGAAAGTLRIATYDVGLARDGAGVLLWDLGRDPDPALAAVLTVIRTVRPDVLLLSGIDDDVRGRTLDAFRGLLRQGPDGIDYAFAFRAPVNAGEPSGRDLDGDGRLMGWNDAFGWGKFPGNGGMALLSRLPIDTAAARTFQHFAWSELPDALLPVRPDGSPFPDREAQPLLRLSSRSHWDVPVTLPDGRRLNVLASRPTPPLFDGEEGFNRRRNHDEIRFWADYLDGVPFRDDTGATAAAPASPLVVLGDLGTDPFDGAGLHDGIAGLLDHPRLRDPRPTSPGGVAAAAEGVNARQRGPAAADTADWRDDPGPGNLRVDYVLPSAELRVIGSGVFWPGPGEPLADVAAAASAHRLVWIDVALP